MKFKGGYSQYDDANISPCHREFSLGSVNFHNSATIFQAPADHKEKTADYKNESVKQLELFQQLKLKDKASGSSG